MTRVCATRYSMLIISTSRDAARAKASRSCAAGVTGRAGPRDRTRGGSPKERECCRRAQRAQGRAAYFVDGGELGPGDRQILGTWIGCHELLRRSCLADGTQFGRER